jgi:hypothetical protein
MYATGSCFTVAVADTDKHWQSSSSPWASETPLDEGQEFVKSSGK